MPFSAIFKTASGCCFYFIPAIERLIPCFLTRNTWSCHLLHRSFPGFYDAGRFGYLGEMTGQSCFEFDVDHKKLGHFISFWKIKDRTPTWRFGKMIFLFNWVPCLGTMWILGGFSKQIDELKYPPASTPYFNSLELALWTVWILHRSSMFSSFAWSEAECCVYCLGGEGFVSFSSQGLHPSKGLETLMKGGLGDVFVDLFFWRCVEVGNMLGVFLLTLVPIAHKDS